MARVLRKLLSTCVAALAVSIATWACVLGDNSLDGKLCPCEPGFSCDSFTHQCKHATCAAGKSFCGGAGDGCVDLQNDPTNCGACQHDCDPAFGLGACVAGACATPSCSRINGTCGDAGACASIVDKAAACGGCDNRCPDNFNCFQGLCGCKTGACGIGNPCKPQPIGYPVDVCDCGAGFCRVGETCSPQGGCSCNGGAPCANKTDVCCQGPAGCFNLFTDPDHCGACDHRCQPGYACTLKKGTIPYCGCTGPDQCAGGTCNADGICVCDGAVCEFERRCIRTAAGLACETAANHGD